MKTEKTTSAESNKCTEAPSFGFGGAAVVNAAACVADAAGDADQLENGTIDEKHAWISRRIADVVDATDKAFGEPRVEDRERMVRAKTGLKAGIEEG